MECLLRQCRLFATWISTLMLTRWCGRMWKKQHHDASLYFVSSVRSVTMCQRTRLGVGGRSRRYTTRLRQRSLDRPSCLPVTHGVCSWSWMTPRGWSSAYDAQTTCPMSWSAYIGCAFRSTSSLNWPYLRTRSSTVARHRTLIHSSVWSTYRVDELSAPPTLAALSSHSPTGPPLATEPFLLLVPRSGTVCQRRSDQRHHWTPFAGVRRLICSLCHICNWLTSVSGPCSKSLLRPL